MQSEKEYPFKYLNAYGRNDKDFYFGRNEEVEQLYEMASQTDLLLLYGVSGTGKTSMLKCGLANRLELSDWFVLTIRRGANINLSLGKALNAAIGNDTEYIDDHHDMENETDNTRLVRQIKTSRLKHIKPIYLIFDQFEELYILGNKQEQNEFYQTVKQVLALNLSVKIIIAIREEYLEHLHDFEQVVPGILQKRLRIEPMTLDKIREVLQGINNPEKSLVTLQKGEKDKFIETVYDQLHKEKDRIDLSYFQSLMDKLYLSLTNNDEKRDKEAVFTCASLEKLIHNANGETVRKASRTTRWALIAAGLFLLLAIWQFMEASRAGERAKKEYQRAQYEYHRAEKLINAFYFYDGKYALAYNDNRYYFINKEGDEVEKLGSWKKAEQFNIKYYGFAKVTDWDETTYLLDTLGIRNKYANKINYLDSSIQAMDVNGQLSVKLTDDIGKLINLTQLWLYHNNITGLPPGIGNLTKLTRLDLSENKIKSLPHEIGKLTNLPSLNLSNNQITALPPEIGNLINLAWSDMSDNKITGLPHEIGNLSKLNELDLTNNQIADLPHEIGNLTGLTGLSLHNNRITNLPREIGNLSKLMYLDLADNKLTSLPSEIGKLKSLVWLYLSRNKITSLPNEIWNLTNLTGLDLSGNNITSLPPEIGNMPNLTWLILSDNNITGLPPEIVNLPNLTGLDLSGTKITHLPPEIVNLPNLRTINCDNTPLDNFSKALVEKINNPRK